MNLEKYINVFSCDISNATYNRLLKHNFIYIENIRKVNIGGFLCRNCGYYLYAAMGGLCLRSMNYNAIIEDSMCSIFYSENIVSCDELIIKSIIE